MSDLFEKKSFIKRFEHEILPLLDDTSCDLEISETDLVLERFETKVFSFENPASDGVQVMLEASQPASRTAVEQILTSLLHDEDCRGITLVTDNAAGSTFAKDHPEFLPEHSKNELLIADIRKSPDTCLVFAEEPTNSPAPLFLHSAKSVFGAKRLYVYIADQHINTNALLHLSEENRKHMDDIDALLVSDPTTKALASQRLSFPLEKILVVGNPAIDKIYQEDKEAYRTEGRSLLNLDEGTTALLYSGFPSSDYAHIYDNPELNLQTLSKTLVGIRLAAENSPDKSFALIVRTHPRDAQKIELLTLLDGTVPDNLKLIDGNSVNYQQAIYASDGIVCMASSSEHSMGKYRGRKVFITAYHGANESGDITRSLYGDAIETFTDNTYVQILQTPETLAENVISLQILAPLETPQGKSSTEIMTDLLLKK